MKFFAAASVGLSLAGLATAAPLTARAAKLASEIVLEIAPSSGKCDGANPQCRTNMQVGPLFVKSAAQYGLDHAAPIAAVLALTAFESESYAFNTNQQGHHGQGTSNMQNYPFNLEYAQSIPALADKLKALGTPDALKNADDATKDKVRDLVTTDEYNFGSGPWFLTKKCTPDVITTLKTNLDAGFTAYMACVGVTVTSDRQDFWGRAKTAFDLH